ncbi:MAG: 1-acyl-sn-glycerol-3-phosphate acyltransferase [Anaerolineales bacterium]|nr:1-acyl-sn-glycerol-3-phosphate acyltransferase [Anaerolineales bacterium]
MYLQKTSQAGNYQSNHAGQKALYWLGCVLVNKFTDFIKPDVVCHAPLPSGVKIFAANHPTTLDPFLMLSFVPEQVSILVTADVFKIPAFGHYLRSAGHIPVFKTNGKATIEQALKLLDGGLNVGIFPEGALSPLGCEPGFGRAHTGAVRLALNSGAPIIPVGISLPLNNILTVRGKNEQNPWFARCFLTGPYAVSIGAPMWLSGDPNDRERVQRLSDELICRISALSSASQLRISAHREGCKSLEIGRNHRPNMYGQQSES